MSNDKKLRNVWITLFVIVWTVVFHYESLRYFYLNPFLNPVIKRDLPKVPLLFPPAGWIMFFNVSDQFSGVEFYGRRNGHLRWIDPHEIYSTRFIGFDNIHRGILGTAVDERYQRDFCEYLKRKLPAFEEVDIFYYSYPSLSKEPEEFYQRLMYVCR